MSHTAQDFTIGQRWINVAEPAQGIGMIIELEHRTVTVIFPATGDSRIYAKQSAPLSRVVFNPGDALRDQTGNDYVVESVDEHQGLFVYHCTDKSGEPVRLPEGKIDHFIQLNQPLDRLLNGQIDKNQLFSLRKDTQKYSYDLATSPVAGVNGCRTTLLEHQLYIANEVGKRYAPRVLLADEVGLGKTIEAGLIIHHQLLCERAKRVLIILPESLVHQWLVEMLRRFNLFFRIFNEERCEAIVSNDDEAMLGLENPFETEQLVICSIDFLKQHPRRFKQACDANWDLMVVDEAHHLEWSEDAPSEEYQMVDKLAQTVKGVLLLTATPEQLGKASHFARLRLLDPDRFSSLEQFIEEEKGYKPIAQCIDALLEKQPLTAEMKTLIQEFNGVDDDNIDELALEEETSQRWIDQLLDRHGTGRILFRNTRHAIEGFPQRNLSAHGLEAPKIYLKLLEEMASEEKISEQLLLSPEILFRALFEGTDTSWLDHDPRVAWLADFLIENMKQKILVITSDQQTALSLATGVMQHAGIHAAVFHEGMSLLERDKAAAYFADQETGTQVLICSEIGSEGRNFQFAHQMVLFDLPYNPDLLEQRIGRLDRIGQSQDIIIHVPYMKGTAQETLLNWYHQGINAFELTCPAGHQVFKAVEHELSQLIKQKNMQKEGELIDKSFALYEAQMKQILQGRDRLLEYNSCRPAPAKALLDKSIDLDWDDAIITYMEKIYDCYGINSEIKGVDSWLLKGSDHMMTKIPGFQEDGMTITYHRDIALSNEDVQFLTWDHPLVRNCMEMVSTSELGNTALSAIQLKSIPAGRVLLECFYIVDLPHDKKTQSHRYLAPTTVRVLMDETGKHYEHLLSVEQIEQLQQKVDKRTAFKIVNARASVIKSMLQTIEAGIKPKMQEIVSNAHQQSQKVLASEIDRLNELKQLNGNVRDQEINFYQQQLKAVDQIIDKADMRLDAVKVIVAM